jgi:hypothetical protein
MCGAGHNLRLILARLRALYCALIAVTAELAGSVARVARSAIDSPRRLLLAI